MRRLLAVQGAARAGAFARVVVAIVVTLATLAVAAPVRAAMVVEATLSAGSVEVGSTVTLVIGVTDPPGGIGTPQFALPPGLVLVASSQARNMSWVNGRASTRLEWQYQIGAQQVGRYVVGPFRVSARGEEFELPGRPLGVTPASLRSGTPGPVPRGRVPVGATLTVELTPRRPYVGQATRLALRLSQTQRLMSNGGNGTPSTTGFWAEGYGDPVEYRGALAGRPAIVTERRCRVYPLAPGRATVGSAAMLVMVPVPGADPFSGEAASAPAEIRSESLHVDVLPLPGGAPAGFANAVGAFGWEWALDRGHTTQDQAITLRLDVRGLGNLPLLRTPPLSLPDFDVFQGTVDDSFAPAGELGAGRRRFQWTLSPRHPGTLRLEPPPMAWFDPAAGSYRSVVLPPLQVVVLAAGRGVSADVDAAAVPAVFRTDEAHPGARAANAWLLALGGLLVGLAVRCWRGARTPDAHATLRAQREELLHALRTTRGTDFQRAAEAAAVWAAERGAQVLRLREEIAAARFGGVALPEDDVRRRVSERLADLVPASRRTGSPRVLAGALVLLAVGAWALGRPVAGPEALAVRAREADGLAHRQQLAAAEAAWTQLWREAPGDPALAARLGWAAMRREQLAEAAAWVLRGRRGEPRSAALAWLAARVREAGGLVGEPGGGVPLRRIECGALAFALALGALLEWPRRWRTGGLLALALLAAALPLVRGARAGGEDVAVTRAAVALGGADLDLEPGQVVRVLARRGGRLHVRAGRDVVGDLPASAVLVLERERP